MTVWNDLFACSYCSNYNSEKESCKKRIPKLSILDLVRGCENLNYNGKVLDFSILNQIPKDSYLRRLTIEDLASRDNDLRGVYSSSQIVELYDGSIVDFEPKDDGLGSSVEKEGKVLSFEDFEKKKDENYKRKLTERVLKNSKSF